MKLNRLITGLCVFASAFAPLSWADADQLANLTSMVESLTKTVTNLQNTVVAQNAKIRDLENRKPESSGGSVDIPPPMSDYEFGQRLEGALGGANKWLKDLSFKGDVRFRYEAFENSSGNPSETDDRNRFRYRLRFAWEKKFNEEVKVGWGLASGETSSGTNVDPTSTNTTFDNLFNFKDILVEKVYAEYSPAFMKIGPIDKFTIVVGKQNNPFEKGSSDMIWDRDVKPEGVTEQVNIKVFDSRDVDVNLYATAGQFILDEDATVGGDAEMFAQQAGISTVFYTPFLERPVDVHIAGSWYSYHDYEDFGNFSISGTSLARGNINQDGNANQLDAKDFEVLGLYNEIAIYPMGLPVRGFFEIAGNPGDRSLPSGIDGENMAFSFGGRLGGIVKKGDWELSYAYKRIEANSVVGAFNDSDFGTNAHAGNRGSVVKAGYALTDNIQLNAAAFFVNNLNTGTVSGARGLDEEQKRFQFDMVYKF